MVDVDSNFSFMERDGKVVSVQSVKAVMSVVEAIRKFADFRKDLENAVEQESSCEKFIADGVAEKNLETAKGNTVKIKDICEKMGIALKPLEDELYSKLCVRVHAEKLREKYDRCKGDRRIAVSNQILGKLVSEFGLEVKDTVCMKLRSDFDKL